MTNHVFDTNRTADQEKTLMTYFRKKYEQVIDSLQRGWITPQFALDTLDFDVNTPTMYVDSDFDQAVRMKDNLADYRLVRFSNEQGRQANRKSAYTSQQYADLLQRSTPDPQNWIMDVNGAMQIADTTNTINYFKTVVENLMQLE